MPRPGIHKLVARHAELSERLHQEILQSFEEGGLTGDRYKPFQSLREEHNSVMNSIMQQLKKSIPKKSLSSAIPLLSLLEMEHANSLSLVDEVLNNNMDCETYDREHAKRSEILGRVLSTLLEEAGCKKQGRKFGGIGYS
ncbi:MAG: hypothetical protein JW834_02685 [Candidatus Diapherotrites archaeon]|nr:hypothetical protein [Candidatus Diapherotrites archaeon]